MLGLLLFIAQPIDSRASGKDTCVRLDRHELVQSIRDVRQAKDYNAGTDAWGLLDERWHRTCVDDRRNVDKGFVRQLVSLFRNGQNSVAVLSMLIDIDKNIGVARSAVHLAFKREEEAIKKNPPPLGTTQSWRLAAFKCIERKIKTGFEDEILCKYIRMSQDNN